MNEDKKFKLTPEERERAKKELKKEKKQKQEIKKALYRFAHKREKEISKLPQLYEEETPTTVENIEKYKRPTWKIDERKQKAYQFVQKHSNRIEYVKNAKWEHRAKILAETTLAETDIIRQTDIVEG